MSAVFDCVWDLREGVSGQGARGRQREDVEGGLGRFGRLGGLVAWDGMVWVALVEG